MNEDVPLRYPVNALVSYHYFDETNIAEMASWGLRLIADSGAYSAASIGAPVRLENFADWAHRWKDHVAWVASLDEIGDVEGSWHNYRRLRDDFDLDVIPTVHYGADPSMLDRYANDGVDFVGLGGMVPYKSEPKRLLRWCLSMFRYAKQAHPDMRFHGWGVTHPLLIMSLPWFSVDSSGFSSAYRYARLSLFDPRKGKTVGVTLDGRDVFKYSVLLRDVYGVDPAAIAVSTSETRRPLVRVALSAVQKTEDYLRQRHGLIPSPKYGVRDSAAGAHIHADGKAFPAFGEDTALGFPTAWQGDAIKGGPHVHSALGFPTAQATKGLSPEDADAPVVEEGGPHVHYVGTGPYLGAAGPPGSERRSDIGFPGRGAESIRGPETQRGTSLRQTGGPVIHASIGSPLTDFSYIVNRKGTP